MKKNAPIPEVRFQNRNQKDFEFLIASNREILLGPRFGAPNPFRPHRIQFYSILFILEGSGRHFIDFKSYDYQRGSIIFISPEQVHRFEWNDDRAAYFLNFTKNFLEKSSLGSNLMQQLSLYNYHLYSPVLQLEEDQLIPFIELVLRIKDEYEAPADFFTEEIIQSSLKIFLGMAERIRKKNRAAQKTSKYHNEFLQFQQLLQAHLLSNRQVKFYADAMTISTKKLNRITQEIMQQPAKTYIHELAVMEMKRLLMNTSLSIKEIAFKTGFEEPTNFVKYFRKLTGLTPVSFRKQYKLMDA